MNKLVELNREYWGRVHDMCEGTNVKPWECVKYEGCDPCFHSHPTFTVVDSNYEFAVAILEGKPVFPGNEVYRKCDGGGIMVTVIGFNNINNLIVKCKNGLTTFASVFDDDYFSWNPPPKTRTFHLNGVELPCPNASAIYGNDFSFEIGTERFVFFKKNDRDKTYGALINLLTEARDK